MTYEQGVRLASRATAIYLIVWAVSDAIGVPHEIMAVWHDLQAVGIPRDAMPTGLEDTVVYYLRSSIILFAGTILRITLWLMAARWFYYGAPRIQRFFGIEDTEGQGPDSYQPGVKPQVSDN